MALIAHYPLNGDTEDYSGYGNDLTPHGFIPSDEFIGAHKTTTNSDYLVTSKEWVYDQEVTLAIWAKETGKDGSGIAGLISDHHHSPSPMTGITIYNRPNQLTFAIGLGTSRPSYSFNHLFDSSEWCHYAVTYNNGLVKVYQNGVMLGSTNVPPIAHVVGRVGCLGRWSPSYSTYNLVGSLADGRVYDHALSDKEIKELAKAKVLHYKFDEHEEPTENLAGGVTSFYSPYHTLEKSGNNFKMVMVSANHIVIGNGKAYQGQTVSVSGYLFKNGLPHVLPNKRLNTYHSKNASKWLFNSVTGYFEITQEWTSTSAWLFHTQTGAVTGDVLEIKNMQFELKDTPTGYTTGVRGGGSIVKDSSGFGNDGTVAVATAPSWSEDSPVGRGSMVFDGSLITTGKLFYNSEQTHTISAWVKPTNSGISNQQLVNFHQGYRLFHTSTRSLMYMNSGTNDHYVYGSQLTENKWTHVTWVYDKSSLRCQVYYDGVLNASSSNFTAIDVPSGFSATTIFGTNFVGNITDVRIYATALTPEDIKELYQTRASIDNLGNLFIHEFDEVSGDTLGINSQGIAKFTSINEVGRPVRYIRDWLNGSTANTSNHWVEIQAIDPSGNNVAKGKTSPSALITDGSTATNPYYSGGSGLSSVTVDLGTAHNITYLHIWHYWSDKRTYHKTKTEVSTDGTNWVTVFDSAVEGEYAESSEGKKILLYPDKVSFSSDGNIYTNEILEN